MDTISIDDLANLKDIAIDYGRFGDNYIILHFRPEDIKEHILSEPTCIAGLTFYLLKSGNATVNIDFKDVELSTNSLMSTDPNTKFSVKAPASADAEVIMLSFAGKFLHDLNFDMHTLNLHEFVGNRPDSVTKLSDTEAQLFEHIAQVLLMNAKYNSEPTFSMQIAKSLTQALIYQQFQVISSRSKRSIVNSDSPTGNRQLAYVQEFMHQLQLHHSHHRALSFYADKLCISQKYLSHVIKEATGRSASEWIAEYVVMEAKNQLRFSNKNVQQVAYSLNFPTQSSFGKYFKHVTGISPSEFLKG